MAELALPTTRSPTRSPTRSLGLRVAGTGWKSGRLQGKRHGPAVPAELAAASYEKRRFAGVSCQPATRSPYGTNPRCCGLVAL